MNHADIDYAYTLPLKCRRRPAMPGLTDARTGEPARYGLYECESPVTCARENCCRESPYSGGAPYHCVTFSGLSCASEPSLAALAHYACPMHDKGMCSRLLAERDPEQVMLVALAMMFEVEYIHPKDADSGGEGG